MRRLGPKQTCASPRRPLLKQQLHVVIDLHGLPTAPWAALQLGGHITHLGHLPDTNNQPYLEYESINVQAEHESHPDSCLFPGPVEGPNSYMVSEAVVNLLGGALCLPPNA